LELIKTISEKRSAYPAQLTTADFFESLLKDIIMVYQHGHKEGGYLFHKSVL
jgi:hypothetical protein